MSSYLKLEDFRGWEESEFPNKWIQNELHEKGELTTITHL